MSDAAANVDYLNELLAAMPSGGNAVVQREREAALAIFQAAGFPGPHEEDWKYTRLRPVERRRLQPAAEPDAAAVLSESQVAALALPGLDGPRLVFVDGFFVPALSSVTPADGLRIRPLAETLRTEPEELAAEFAQAVDLQAHRFAALNTAFFRDGADIEILAGATLAAPVYLLFLGAATGSETMISPRVRIRARPGSSLTVVEHHASLPGSACLSNALTSVALQAGAQLEHYRVQDESEAGWHLSGLHVRQARDSRFVSRNFDLGGRIARQDLHVRLEEPGAEAVLDGLFVARGRRHVDNHTRVDHLAPDTRSTEDYRGVLSGRSRGVFNGKVIVHPGALKTDANQSSRNLLLSDGAEIDTKPELEIYADDVRCSHGATVGRLDREALFYLRSRGIDEETARSLLIFAFADDLMARIGLQCLRPRLEEAVLARLPQADQIREFL